MRATSITRTIAIIIAGVLAIAAIASWRSDRAESNGELVAMFKDSSPLDPGNEVRAAGVVVGTVQSITLHNGLAAVRMSVDKSVLPIHQDATVTIRPINVLGEHYVDIYEGSPTSPMLTSGVVDVARTGSSVTLQDVLDTFNQPTAAGVAALLETLGTGVEGNGAVVAAAISKLAPAMASTQQVGKILDGQILTLEKVISQLAPISASLATDRGRTLNQLVANTTQTLGILAAQHQALDSSIGQLPATLDTVVATLNRLSALTAVATPVLRSVRPVTGNLKDVSNELNSFTQSANPALQALIPVVRDAQKLIDQAAPISQTLRASGNDLRGAAKGLRPLGDQVLNKNLYGLMQFVREWALSTNARDGLSNYFRGVFHLTPNALMSLIGVTPVSATKSTTAGTKLGKNPLGNLLGNPLNGLNNLVGGLLGGITPHNSSGGNGALGLSQGQETNLLNQLLGGL